LDALLSKLNGFDKKDADWIELAEQVLGKYNPEVISDAYEKTHCWFTQSTS
jgi:hypothetical protein